MKKYSLMQQIMVNEKYQNKMKIIIEQMIKSNQEKQNKNCQVKQISIASEQIKTDIQNNKDKHLSEQNLVDDQHNQFIHIMVQPKRQQHTISNCTQTTASCTAIDNVFQGHNLNNFIRVYYNTHHYYDYLLQFKQQQHQENNQFLLSNFSSFNNIFQDQLQITDLFAEIERSSGKTLNSVGIDKIVTNIIHAVQEHIYMCQYDQQNKQNIKQKQSLEIKLKNGHSKVENHEQLVKTTIQNDSMKKIEGARKTNIQNNDKIMMKKNISNKQISHRQIKTKMHTNISNNNK